MDLDELFAITKTNVTKTVHQRPYDFISPLKPEVSQAGKTVLVSGGGTGVGYGISQAFVRASADTVIIIGRRQNVLDDARSRLEAEAKSTGTGTKVIIRACDVTNFTEVDGLWKEFGEQGIVVDVYVANAAMFTEPKPLLELGTDDVWQQLVVNVKAPLYFTEKFHAQGAGKQKFIISVSTGSIHSTHWGVVARPAYTLSKTSGTLLFQLLAQDLPVSDTQIISFHPGLIYNDYWKSLGLTPERFDSEELAGAFAVWAASKEAAFLHGRYVWASWDMEELATGEHRKRINEDDRFLRVSVVGLKEGNLATLP